MQNTELMADAVLPVLSEAMRHNAADAKVEKVYLYPKPVDFRKSIDGLGALVELDLKSRYSTPCFSFFQPAPQPREDFVLGAQRILSLA